MATILDLVKGLLHDLARENLYVSYFLESNDVVNFRPDKESGEVKRKFREFVDVVCQKMIEAKKRRRSFHKEITASRKEIEEENSRSMNIQNKGNEMEAVEK